MFESFRTFETTLAGRPLVIETGMMAQLASGSCMVRYGETSILCTVTASAKPREGVDFFPMSVEIGGQWYYATFFYESAWCFLIVIFLLNAQRKRWFRCDGDAFSAYVFLYALERSIVEGMRADSLYLGPMRVSQLLSIAAMIAVAAVWIARNKFNGKRDEKQKNRGE